MRLLIRLACLLFVALPAQAIQIQEIDPQIPVAAKDAYFLGPDAKSIWMEERRTEPSAYPRVFQIDTRTGDVQATLHLLKPQPAWWGILSAVGSDQQTLAVSPHGHHAFGFFPFDLSRLPQKSEPLQEDGGARNHFQKSLTAQERLLPPGTLAARINLDDGRVHLISPMEPFQDSERHIAQSVVALSHVALGQGDRYLAAAYRASFPDTHKEKTGIRIWNTQTGKVHADLPFGAPAFHGHRLFVLKAGEGPSQVLAYYPPQFALESDWHAPLRARHLTLSPDGRTMALLGSEEDQLALFRLPGLQELSRVKISLPAQDGDRFQVFQWSPDSRFLAMASRKGRLFILNTAKNQWVGRYDLQIAKGNPLWGEIAMQWASNDALVIVGGRGDLAEFRPVIIRLTGPF